MQANHICPKSYYMECKSLHALAKFASTIQRIQVGNGQYVAVLFVIPVIVDICGHRFECLSVDISIRDTWHDLVLGMKNVFELEGFIDMKDSSFKFLNRSLPFYSKDQVIFKPKEEKIYKDRSTMCRWDLRPCDSENVRQQRTGYSGTETKVCKKLCITGCHKQHTGNGDIWAKTSFRHPRFKIPKLLQYQAGIITTKFE